MYTSEMAIREVNQYYARRGSRTAAIKNYASVGSFAEQMKRAAASARTAPVQTDAETSASKEDTQQTDKDFCCEACRQSSQLTMQLWRSLYLQNSLGSFSTGSGALTAYQNMKNILGANIL